MSHEPDDEAGFTLVELLLVIVILGLLLTPVALTFSLAAKTTGDSASRTTVAMGLNTVTAYFGNDVQSARTVTVPTVPSATAPCGASGDAILVLQGTDQDDTTLAPASATSYTTAYLLRVPAVPYSGPSAADQRELVRVVCLSSGGGVLTESVLAGSVSTGTQATCTSSCSAATSSPTGVSLALKAFPASLTTASDTTTYEARRRSS